MKHFILPLVVLVVVFALFCVETRARSSASYSEELFRAPLTIKHGVVPLEEYYYDELDRWPRQCRNGRFQSPISFVNANISRNRHLRPIRLAQPACQLSSHDLVVVENNGMNIIITIKKPRRTAVVRKVLKHMNMTGHAKNESYKHKHYKDDEQQKEYSRAKSNESHIGKHSSTVSPAAELSDCFFIDPVTGKQLYLSQLHLHMTPEHHFDGLQPNLELHLVFKALHGVHTAVIAIPVIVDNRFRGGAGMHFFSFILEGWYPRNHSEKSYGIAWREGSGPLSRLFPGSELSIRVPLPESVFSGLGKKERQWLVRHRVPSVPEGEAFTGNLQHLVPQNDDSYITYSGSLTSPPCTEGVRWFVFTSPIYMLQRSADSFNELLRNNYVIMRRFGGRIPHIKKLRKEGLEGKWISEETANLTEAQYANARPPQPIMNRLLFAYKDPTADQSLFVDSLYNRISSNRLSLVFAAAALIVLLAAVAVSIAYVWSRQKADGDFSLLASPVASREASPPRLIQSMSEQSSQGPRRSGQGYGALDPY